jgi:hypothetical protein
MQNSENRPSRTRSPDGTLRITNYSENADRRVICKWRRGQDGKTREFEVAL